MKDNKIIIYCPKGKEIIINKRPMGFGTPKWKKQSTMREQQ